MLNIDCKFLYLASPSDGILDNRIDKNSYLLPMPCKVLRELLR